MQAATPSISSEATIRETLERLQKHKGVIGLLVLGADGQIIKSTLDDAAAADHAAMLPGLTAMARAFVRELDAADDLQFLRVRGARHEILVAPKDEFVLVVLQEPLAH